MIHRLIALSLKYRAVVLAVSLGLAGLGTWALLTTPVDAIPDLSDNQVIVFTDWTGHSAQEVEDQVSYPLTTILRGLAGVRVVRGQSAFGFSMVYVIFSDDVDLYFARARVSERLGLAATRLPAGVTPVMGPDATGVGHVFWYTVESAGISLRDLRTLQDWLVRPQLASVPGVAEVASVGGYIRQYEIDVDPNRLRAFNVSIGEVVRAVQASNANVGGNVLEANGTWSVVRGLGLVTSVDDIADTPIRAVNGVAVTVRQVANVKIGDAFRVASLVKGTSEAVGGVVVARAGANTRDVIAAVKTRIRQIEPNLPSGARIVPFYDRSVLIDQTVDTLRIALIEEIILVVLAHVLFLWHVRSVLVVTLPLPLAAVLSFLAMRFGGVTSNIMSLSGLAIAIGVLVDAAIVVTENAMRHLEQHGVDLRDGPAVRAHIAESTSLVGRPVWFSMAIIVVAFAPVFFLGGQEGKLFHPLAFAKTAAVVAAAVIAVTLVPVLCTLFLRGRLHHEGANPIMRWCQAAYRPVLAVALAHRATTLLVAAALFVGALAVGSRIGSEFMPALNEGDLMFMPIADPSISLAGNTDLARRQNAALLAVPEVESVVAKVARADTSTDPAPLNMTETIVHLRPRSQWRPGLTTDSLRGEMSRAVQLPGVASIWTMPIINRIDMLTTGIRSELGIKIFGSDLEVLERLASEIAGVLREVPGAANVYPEAAVSGQYLNVQVDRAAAARQGLTVAAVEEAIAYGIGEIPIGMTIEGRARFPIRVRYAPEFRASAEDVGQTLVTGPAGQQVPLKSVATLTAARGPAMISSEDGFLLTTVLLNVERRDPGRFVADATAALARVPMPAGYSVRWSGQYEHQQHAERQLRIVLPIVVLLIFGLLCWTYRSALEALHVLLAVPFALTGGVYLLWALGYNLSVAVWVGFIALLGTAVQTGVVMVIYLHEAVERRRASAGRDLTRPELREAIMEGATLRLRPKLMTVSTVVAGLLPIMWSTRVGAEVMKPIATPVLGGMLSSLAHVLVVTPVLFYLIHARRLAAEPVSMERPRQMRGLIWVIALSAVLVAGFFGWRYWRAPEPPALSTLGTVVHRAQVDDLTIAIAASEGHLHLGRNPLLVEFRSTATQALVDMSDVRVSASMTMPGMTMASDVQVSRSKTPGRFAIVASLKMAGAWQFRIEWTTARGDHRTMSFEGAAQ